MANRLAYLITKRSADADAVAEILDGIGVTSQTHASPDEFIAALRGARPGVVITCSKMLDELLAAFASRKIGWPIITVVNEGDVAEAVRVMHAGAYHVIERPVDASALADLIDRGLADLHGRLAEGGKQRTAKERIALLSVREFEILRGLLGGMSNKLLARHLDLSLRTVEMHRANMMARLEAKTLAEALTLAVQAELKPFT